MFVSVGSPLKKQTAGDPVPMAAQPFAELSPIAEEARRFDPEPTYETDVNPVSTTPFALAIP
jgi:hypothetical protein